MGKGAPYADRPSLAKFDVSFTSFGLDPPAEDVVRVLLVIMPLLAGAAVAEGVASLHGAKSILVTTHAPALASGSLAHQSWHGCKSSDLATRAEPSAGGPAHLERFDCLQLPSTPFTSTPPIISPDRRHFAVHQYARGLLVGSLDDDQVAQVFPFDPTFDHFVGITADSQSTVFFHWAVGSRSIWAVEQQTGRGHFAAGPLLPVLVTTEGTKRAVSMPKGRLGTLDGVMWIGEDGLALAQFGTKGGYYRPEHPDFEPAIAFVDFKRGKLLGKLLLKDYPRAVTAQGEPYVPTNISAVLLPDGRPTAIFQWPSGYSLIWTAGTPPQEITLPKLPWGARIALAPRGQQLLISYPLSATGMICEYHSRNSAGCPPPTPVTGLMAELVDVRTGRPRWQLRGTAKTFEHYPEPAISPDGHYALIGIPKRGGHDIALVSMDNGKILQTLPAIWSAWSVAFGGDSRHFFVSGGSFVASYKIAER